jgi:hypothetical protein
MFNRPRAAVSYITVINITAVAATHVTLARRTCAFSELQMSMADVQRYKLLNCSWFIFQASEFSVSTSVVYAVRQTSRQLVM